MGCYGVISYSDKATWKFIVLTFHGGYFYYIVNIGFIKVSKATCKLGFLLENSGDTTSDEHQMNVIYETSAILYLPQSGLSFSSHSHLSCCKDTPLRVGIFEPWLLVIHTIEIPGENLVP